MKANAGLALIVLPGMLAAQTTDTLMHHDSVVTVIPATDSRAPVLDHTFNGPGEFVRFFMAGGIVYRAMVDRPDVQLIVEPVSPEGPKVSVIELQRFNNTSGEREYLIRPKKDGDYQLRVPFALALDTTASGATIGPRSGSSRLLLYRDTKETNRENAPAAYAWAFGIEAAGGAGQMYAQSGSTTPTGTAGAYEACLAAQYGSGFGGFVSGCLLGARHETPHGQRGVTWVFIEPRFRLVGSNARWDKPLDAGVAFRAGLGQFDGANVQPGLLAPGAYLHFTALHKPHWPKLVLEGEVRYDVIIASSIKDQHSVEGTFGLGIF